MEYIWIERGWLRSGGKSYQVIDERIRSDCHLWGNLKKIQRVIEHSE
ncbi:hypothetical protein AM1_H0077 (plasmid) [Acaryochloris marina MBIC11017]|uniref:Uncharacterized protein n=1 Tax=Acaryochloris marina (strain MBIC 11017) TaxID=329726 RepID=A8ZQZ1_ACAM1|nr:hypothetical protein AM1_H0077 [Acaryochloris marina MBIC11017]